MPPAELSKRQLEVTVWHHQSDGRLEFLGEFLLDLAGLLFHFFLDHSLILITICYATNVVDSSTIVIKQINK